MSTVDEAKRISALRRYNVLDTAPETEFENIISLVQSTFNVPMAAISFIDSDRQWFKASRGIENSETPRDVAFCDHTIREDDVLVVPDAEADKRFADNPFVTGKGGIRCYMGTPLRTPDGQNIGSLCVIGTDPRQFSADEAAILAGFASLVVSQLELRQSANLDHLTHTMSRGAFLDQVDIAINAYRKKGICTTLAILDVDRFKDANDTYGHPAGDRILKAFVDTCAANVRADDLVGRLGGDEFAILLRGVMPVTARQILGRIHTRISDISMPDFPDIRVSASIGYTSINSDIQSKEAWIAMTDAALYRAKVNGRDQMVAA